MLDSYLLNVRQNDFNKVYRAKTPRRKEKYLPISPNLAYLASSRESSFFRFCNPKFNRKCQISLASLYGGGKHRRMPLEKADEPVVNRGHHCTLSYRLPSFFRCKPAASYPTGATFVNTDIKRMPPF